MKLQPRFGFIRYLQPSGRPRPITAGQQAVHDELALVVGRLLSARVPSTLDDLASAAARAAARANRDAPAREQLALELLLLIEYGLAQVAPLLGDRA